MLLWFYFALYSSASFPGLSLFLFHPAQMPKSKQIRIFIHTYMCTEMPMSFLNLLLVSLMQVSQEHCYKERSREERETCSIHTPTQSHLTSFSFSLDDRQKAQMPSCGSHFPVMASGSLAHSTDICVGFFAIASGFVNRLSWW